MDNPLNPRQIARRKQNLERIIALAQTQPRLTNDNVQKSLGISDATATRYLEYLLNLGKMKKMPEK